MPETYLVFARFSDGMIRVPGGIWRKLCGFVGRLGAMSDDESIVRKGRTWGKAAFGTGSNVKGKK